MTADEILSFITRTGASVTQRQEAVFETRATKTQKNEKGEDEAIETERVQTGERPLFTLTLSKPFALSVQDAPSLEDAIASIKRAATDLAAVTGAK